MAVLGPVTRLRLLVLLAGAGVLLGGTPALAAPPVRPAQGEATALVLLRDAAGAARTRSWAGTQYVGTWRGALQTSAVLDVTHEPGRGVRLTGADGEPPVAAAGTPELDERMVGLLARHYELAVSGSGRCAGRGTHVVEARRPGVAGRGRVAGRFWVDRDSGLVLRREVYDAAGRRLRSSAFVDVQVDRPVAVLQPTPVAAVGSLPRHDGWEPPRTLGGMDLFDRRVREHAGARVLQLAYSDGLSTLSVFAQPGTLGHEPGHGFRAERFEDARVWVARSSPERAVWTGDEHVFTLVSDADPAAVRAAVSALPHDEASRRGLFARLGRGLSRLGSWLNPFS